MAWHAAVVVVRGQLGATFSHPRHLLWVARRRLDGRLNGEERLRLGRLGRHLGLVRLDLESDRVAPPKGGDEGG